MGALAGRMSARDGGREGRRVTKAWLRLPWYKQHVVTPSVPSQYLLRYDDWLELPHDGPLYELIDGELFVTPPPNIRHQRVSRDLEFLLMTYLRRSPKGELFDAPVGVRLDDRSVLEPDLVIVLREHAAVVGAQVIEGAPDLVIEVLSPGTASRDLGIKREKYRSKCIGEYWIVDPANARVEVLVLENERYVRFGLFTRGDALRSKVLADFELAVGEIFSTD
jgi:Uma2 family endonuclease